jgi:outer membrane protein OmpA-like peptidoglycan-associated protein
MASAATPSNRGNGASCYPFGRVALALCVALGACSPVAAYRNLTGASRDDPNPATTPNSKNLAAGAAAPYPNLATVPPPPTNELTEAQLQHLTQGLAADRAHAKYSSQQLLPGEADTAALPSPAVSAATALPPADLPAPVSPSVAATPAPVRTTALGPPPAPSAAAAATGLAPSPRAATVAPPSAGSMAQANNPPNASPLPSGMESGLRKPGQPPLPGPMESSLVPPRIPETPQPEQPEPAPPPPRLVSLPAAKSGGPAHLPPQPAPAPVPPLGAAAYQPPPPPPVLASPAPTRTAAAAPAAKKPAAPAPVVTPVVDVTFAAGTTEISDADHAALDKVAALYRQHPGKLRVVGYAAVGQAAGDPMTSFRTALDHAQAVAAALAKTGIPASKIAVEATPANGSGSGDHAEVLLLH